MNKALKAEAKRVTRMEQKKEKKEKKEREEKKEKQSLTESASKWEKQVVKLIRSNLDVTFPYLD